MENGKRIKLVLIGPSGTGKTIFIQNLKEDYDKLNFKNNYSTSGAAFAKLDLIYNNTVFIIDIWDTSGQEKYTPLLPIFTNDSDIIFVFYDCSYKKSFERAKFLFELAKSKNNNKNCIYALIGNLYDLNFSSNTKDDIISDEEVLEFAEKNNLIFAHLSIFEKYSQGVIELFKKVFKEYLKIKTGV